MNMCLSDQLSNLAANASAQPKTNTGASAKPSKKRPAKGAKTTDKPKASKRVRRAPTDPVVAPEPAAIVEPAIEATKPVARAVSKNPGSRWTALSAIVRFTLPAGGKRHNTAGEFIEFWLKSGKNPNARLRLRVHNEQLRLDLSRKNTVVGEIKVVRECRGNNVTVYAIFNILPTDTPALNLVHHPINPRTRAAGWLTRIALPGDALLELSRPSAVERIAA